MKKTILRQLNYLTPEELRFLWDHMSNARVGYKEAKVSFNKCNKMLREIENLPLTGLALQISNGKSVDEQLAENECGMVLCDEALVKCESILNKFKQFEGII